MKAGVGGHPGVGFDLRVSLHARSRQDLLRAPLRERLAPADRARELDPEDQALDVAGRAEEAGIDDRVRGRIRARQRDGAAAREELEVGIDEVALLQLRGQGQPGHPASRWRPPPPARGPDDLGYPVGC